MSRRSLRLAATLLALGLSAAFACQCPASSTPTPVLQGETRAPRQIDVNKRRALNLRQARKLTPADKLHMAQRGASGTSTALPGPQDLPAASQPAAAPTQP
ncbi:MAG: hypothetical protein ABIJ09_23175 [Pseudomonadota bacterium]